MTNMVGWQMRYDRVMAKLGSEWRADGIEMVGNQPISQDGQVGSCGLVLSHDEGTVGSKAVSPVPYSRYDHEDDDGPVG
jgi:hypothetical protein